MLITAIAVGYVVFAFVALRWGAESRPGFDGLAPGDRASTLR